MRSRLVTSTMRDCIMLRFTNVDNQPTHQKDNHLQSMNYGG